jgi:tetratricopeptide (TPR) repeat protein
VGTATQFALSFGARFGKSSVMRLTIALFVFATISLHGANDSRPSGANLIETAKVNFKAGNFDAAMAALDQLDKTRGSTAESLDLRGLIYMEQGKLNEANKAFEAAHNANKDLFSARVHFGDVLFRAKKYGKARETYETLARERTTPLWSERLRYAILLTYLAERNDVGGRSALDRIKFPTETPAYYYAQAAWEFAHDRKDEAKKWIKTADRMFDANSSNWYARLLFELGWLKKKPDLVPI